MARLKHLFFILFFLAGFVLPAQKKTVRLELSYYEPYCGGARPTDEMMAEAQRPKPFATRKLILLAKSGKVDTVMTDALGKVKLRLKKGDYTLMEPWRYYRASFNGAPIDRFDSECLKNEWTKATVKISVTAKKATVVFTNELHNYCDWAVPCLLESQMPPLRE